MALVQEYLDYTKKWKKEYGEKTIVLLQCGSFYEAYSLKHDDNTFEDNTIEEFSAINDLVIAKKNSFIDGKQVVMAGFGVSYVDKYIRRMQEHDYTVVIYTQDANTKNTTRSLSQIISPGTYFVTESQSLSNNIMAVWIHKSTPTKFAPSSITIGVANIDIFTGKSSLFQFIVEYNHNPLTYDELERYVSAYKPSEALILTNLDDKITSDIISFVGLDNCQKVHKIFLEQSTDYVLAKTNMYKCAKNAEKQKYQKEVIKKFYPNMSEEVLTNSFPTHFIATQAFVFLLDFIYQHSPNLVQKLHEPSLESHNDKLVLANHSLRQLNIIDDSRHSGKLKSVSSFLNNCVTTMGKRQFLYNLNNPSTNIETLNKSYNITDYLLTEGSLQVPLWDNIRKSLTNIKDIEKFMRKLVLNKICPKDLAMLVTDLKNIIILNELIIKDKTLNNYLKELGSSNIESYCSTIINSIEHNFNIEKCMQLNDISQDSLLCSDPELLKFINKGINEKIDTYMRDSLDGREQLEAIQDYLSSIIGTYEKGGSKKSSATSTDYIKLHETSKSDPVLMGTSRRMEILKNQIAQLKNKVVSISYKSKFTGTAESFDFNLGELEYETYGSNKKDLIVTNQTIKNMTSNIQSTKDKLVQEMIFFYNKYIFEFIKYDNYLETIKNYCTELDMLQCKCYNAFKYNYCKPKIVNDDLKQSKSFINFTGIRHPLIEHLQTNELYVTNDLSLGAEVIKDKDSYDGLLLYGTNAVGKSSFIKSVGIAIIMAQAGLYVPCSSFEYKPYSYIFTRIIGNDNLFKGLSTFAVEMSELRTIITQANENSLVLGDELCSGTESDSALSIFTAGLEHLHKKRSTFLFATHFHEIVKFDEIKALNRLKMAHMAVKYDKEHNTLIYDRKLQDGPGESMYGLEVCKSLSLPDDFLQRAHDIRMKYNNTSQNILAQSTSHFNAEKVVTLCQICNKEKASEVHHLQHQKNAKKDNNYIDSFHKNHPANLLNICTKCHDKIHNEDKQHKVVKTTKGTYVIKEIK